MDRHIPVSLTPELLSEVSWLLDEAAIPYFVTYVLKCQTEDEDDAFDPDVFGDHRPPRNLHKDLFLLFLQASGLDGTIPLPALEIYRHLAGDPTYSLKQAQEILEWYENRDGGIDIAAPYFVQYFAAYDRRYGTSYRDRAVSVTQALADLYARCDGPLTTIERDRLASFRERLNDPVTEIHMNFDVLSEDPDVLELIPEQDALQESMQKAVESLAFKLADVFERLGAEVSPEACLTLDLVLVFGRVAMTDDHMSQREAALFSHLFEGLGQFGEMDRDSLRNLMTSLRKDLKADVFEPDSLQMLASWDAEYGTCLARRWLAVLVRTAALAAIANGRPGSRQHAAFCADIRRYCELVTVQTES